MKKLFTILLLFIGLVGYSQSDVQRSNGLNRLIDPRLAATKTFNPPSFSDTTAANLAKGTDSCGALIFTYDVNSYWERKCSPKRWVQLVDAENYPSIVTNNNSTINIIDSNTFSVCNGQNVCDTFTAVSNFTTMEFITDSSVRYCHVDSTGGVVTNICDTQVIGRQPIYYIANNWIRLTNPNQFVFGSDQSSNNDNFLNYTTYANTGYYRMIWDSRTIYDAGHEFRKMDEFGFPNGTSLVNFFHPDGFLGHINDVKLRVNYTADTVVRSPFLEGYFGDAIGYSLGANFQGHGGYGNYLDNSRSKTALIHFHTFDTTNSKGVTIYAAPNGLAATNNFVLKNYAVVDFNTDKSVTLQGYGSGSSFISGDTTNNKPAAYDANGNLVRLSYWPGSGGSVGGINAVYAGNGLIKVNDSTLKVDTLILSTRDWRQKGDDSVSALITVRGTTDNALTISGTDLNTNKGFQAITYASSVEWDMRTGFDKIITLTGNSDISVTHLQNGDEGNLIVVQGGSGGYSITVPNGTITLNTAVGDTTLCAFKFDGTYLHWAVLDTASGGGSGTLTRIGPIDSLTAVANGAQVSGNGIFMQSATTSFPGLVNIATQSFSGNKTFTGQVFVDTIYGGAASGNNLFISTSTNATKGVISFGSLFKYDEAGGEVRVSTTDYGNYPFQVSSFSAFGFGVTDALADFSTASNTTGSTSLRLIQNNGTEIGRLRGFASTNASTWAGIAQASATQLLGLNSIMLACLGDLYIAPNNTTPVITAKTTGKVGLNGITAPTGWLSIPTGTTTTPPIRITTASAALLTTPLSGSIEVLVDSLYYTGNSGTRYKIYPHGLITPYNGLTKVGTDSLKLGGTLVENTVIATASNTLFLSTATASVNPLSVSASSGIGIYAQSTSGLAISAFTNGSVSGQFAVRDNSTNTVLPVMNVQRRTFNTPAPGIGASIDFYLDATPTTTPLSNSIISKLTDTTTSARTSQFIITGVNSGTAADILTLNGNKSLQFNGYGVNTFAGTPAYLLGVDASGNVVETPTGTTGTYLPTATTVTNVTGYTVNNGTYWYRVGNTITVSGEVQIDPTSTGATELDITLPIASALVNAYDLNGTGVSPVETAEPASFEADATNDRVAIKFVATSTANRTYHFVFTYLVK